MYRMIKSSEICRPDEYRIQILYTDGTTENAERIIKERAFSYFRQIYHRVQDRIYSDNMWYTKGRIPKSVILVDCDGNIVKEIILDYPQEDI